MQCPLKHTEVTSTLTPSVRKGGFTWEMDKQAALRADSEITKCEEIDVDSEGLGKMGKKEESGEWRENEVVGRNLRVGLS